MGFKDLISGSSHVCHLDLSLNILPGYGENSGVAPRNSGRANSSMDEFAQKLHHFSGGRAFASQVPVRVTLARGFDDLRTRSPRETVDEEPIGIDTGLRQTAHVLVV